MRALALVVLIAACKDTATPQPTACNPHGTWRIKVVWDAGTCDIVSPDGDAMRIFVNRGWDGSVEVAKGSKLGSSNVEATMVEAKDCNLVVTASSEDRDPNQSIAVM